jgi:hypothetical protein
VLRTDLHQDAERPDDEDRHRHDPGRGPAHAGGRQPAERDGEQQDRADREPEVGGAGTRERGRAGDAVEGAAGVSGGERADGDGPGERDGHRHGGEPERGRDGLEHDLERRAVLADRVAEVARGEPDQEVAELRHQGLVEAVPPVELLALLDGSVDRQVEVGRAAGEAGEEEDQHDEPDQGEEAVQPATHDEGAHRVGTPSLGRGRRPAGPSAAPVRPSVGADPS